MVMDKLKLYLDGCSFVWGANLDSRYNLNSLFSKEYNVLNQSRGGKSNLAMALDLHKNIGNADIFVVGWTFSTRFYLKVDDVDLDFFPGKSKDLHAMNNVSINLDHLEDAYYKFHKYFYTMYERPFIDEFSDMLIDTAYSNLKQQGKKIIFFSWEKREINCPMYYPYISPEYKLPCQHLNQQGTNYLHKQLIGLLNE